MDPLFDGLTCRISGASPCVDAACAGYASGTDLLGVPRPQGAGVDMGAYEVAAPVTVPDVRGLAPDAAGTLLAGAGLAAGGVSQDYDATVPFGLVAGQTPAAGAQVPRHTPVNMVTSLGPPLTIPDLAGMTQEDAADALAGIGLAIGSVTHGYSITVPAGRILSQTPAAGTPLSAGIRVDIVISLGAIAVPGVAGLTENAASTAITSAGLVVGTIAREYSLTVPAGGIVSQTPAAGTLALPDTAVNLVVSRGALTVPDVTGQTLSNAVLAIQAAQLSGGSLTQEYSLTVPQGSVISQFPAAGTAVLPGTEVNLILSRGGIAVPNVVGQTQNAAAATLAAAQIVVGTFTEQYSLTVPSGTVISQSVTAGTQVLPGAAVNLVVSRGRHCGAQRGGTDAKRRVRNAYRRAACRRHNHGTVQPDRAVGNGDLPVGHGGDPGASGRDGQFGGEQGRHRRAQRRGTDAKRRVRNAYRRAACRRHNHGTVQPDRAVGHGDLPVCPRRGPRCFPVRRSIWW